MTDGNRENLADEFKDLYVFHPVSPKMIVSNKTNGIQNPINMDLHIPLVQPRIQPRKPKVLAGVTDIRCFESKHEGEKDKCTRY